MASAAGAEDVPVAPELLTPPLGLVALLGRPDLHPAVREALRTEARPPMECLSGGELEDASRVLVARKRSRRGPARRRGPAAAIPRRPPPGTPPARCPIAPAPRRPRDPRSVFPGRDRVGAGARRPARTRCTRVPKAGWLAKHRRLRPALALVFLDREDVEGDPNRWISLSTARRGSRRRGGGRLQARGGGGGRGRRRRGGARVGLRRPARRGATAREDRPGAGDAVAAADAGRRQGAAALCKALCAEHYAKEANRRAARTHVDDDARLGGESGFKAGAFSEPRGPGRACAGTGRASGAGRRARRRNLRRRGSSPEPHREPPRTVSVTGATRRIAGCRERGVQEVRAVADARPGRAARRGGALPSARGGVQEAADVAAARVPPRTPRGSRRRAALGTCSRRASRGAGGKRGRGQPAVAPPPPGSPRTYLPSSASTPPQSRGGAAAVARGAWTRRRRRRRRPRSNCGRGRGGTFVDAATGAIARRRALRDLLSNAKETFAALRQRACVCWRRRASTTNARSRFRPRSDPETREALRVAHDAAGGGDAHRGRRLRRGAPLQSRGGCVPPREMGRPARRDADGAQGVLPPRRREAAHLETCLELAALGAGNGAVLVSGHGAFDADAAAHAAGGHARGGRRAGRKRRGGWRRRRGAAGPIARSGASRVPGGPRRPR